MYKHRSKTYINMPKVSKNVDKRGAFSTLVSSYDHLFAMNNKSKTTLVCGRLFVWHHITLELHSHVIRGPTTKLNVIQLAVTYTHMVFLLYFIHHSNCYLSSVVVLWEHLERSYVISQLYITLKYRLAYGKYGKHIHFIFISISSLM